MKPLEANKFYETERQKPTISHLDLSVNEDNDYLSEKLDVNSFLLSKNWENLIHNQTITKEVKHLNYVFEEVFKQYSNKIDAVELFSIVVDFYDLDFTSTFKKLTKKNRSKLLVDLEKNFGHDLSNFKDSDRSNSDLDGTFLLNQ